MIIRPRAAPMQTDGKNENASPEERLSKVRRRSGTRMKAHLALDAAQGSHGACIIRKCAFRGTPSKERGTDCLKVQKARVVQAMCLTSEEWAKPVLKQQCYRELADQLRKERRSITKEPCLKCQKTIRDQRSTGWRKTMQADVSYAQNM